jgi:hypothetical protein
MRLTLHPTQNEHFRERRPLHSNVIFDELEQIQTPIYQSGGVRQIQRESRINQQTQQPPQQ